MSSSNIQVNINEKFTRGEKCIFIHLVLTFVLILIVVLTYIMHLYAVDHALYDVFKTRRSFESTEFSDFSAANIHIGMAYIKLDTPVAVCNTILFSSSWSIAPGYCVAMRSEPDMAYVFPLWRIKYIPRNSDTYDPIIMGTVVHPLFIRNSLSHNIGLFQHSPQAKENMFASNVWSYIYNTRHHDGMIIGSYTKSASEALAGSIDYYPIQIVETRRCDQIMSFIENIREYEFCATFSKNHGGIEHGALVMKDNKIAGMFSWGEKNGDVLPLVILNYTFYERWIQYQTHTDIEK